MIILALLFAAQAESQPANPDDIVFVSSIVVRTDKLTDRELKTAQRYAHCVSFPYFPIGAELTARRDKCLEVRAVEKPSIQLTSVLDQLDNIVAQSAGSEATLTVINPNAPNQ